MTDICISRYKPSQFRHLGEILGIVLVYVASESFPAFWPRSNGSESKEKKTPRSKGFLLSLQFTRGQNAEKLFVRDRLLRRLGKCDRRYLLGPPLIESFI